MNKITQYTVVTLASLFLAACGSDNDSDDGNVNTSSRTYEVKVTNLTNNQPMSPLAVVTHDGQYSAWSIGQPASAGLELLAEGGDNSEFIGSELSGKDASSVSGNGLILPGASDTVEITTAVESQSLITLASMLVNTNDAFAGLDSTDVSGLNAGESMIMYAPVYDAGTEANSEATGTIPGPAVGGEGYNAARDDIADRVSRHSGVVSVDDGLTTSLLDQSHRFDNPALKITITRQ